MESQIQSIGTALPQHRFSQEEVASFMIDYLNLDDSNARWLRKIYEHSGIAYRYSVLSDFKNGGNDLKLFNGTANTPTTGDRASIFHQEAIKLAEAAAQNCLDQTQYTNQAITHLITVSCTGMYAPGLDVELIEDLGLSAEIERTGIHFMGCYAVFNALKTARHITHSQPNAKVLVVAVELCSLHFQAHQNKEQLIANALFGDGSAAALVTSNKTDHNAIAMKDFKSQIIPNTKPAMTWDIGDTGFEMFLSKDIPNLIRDPIKPCIDDLLNRNERQYDQLGHLAAHPGGIRILDVIEENLPLPSFINSASRTVLHHFGNMSSPTILFVLEKLRKQAKEQVFKPLILGMAFGPGLTVETSLFEFND